MSWVRGVEEEELVIVEAEEKDDEEVGGEVVRWEKFLPKGSLRVLLVEGDDSTCQIIAALLRKCNYKVAAVSDGLKAWELLKEKPHSIDVVLAEAELPSVSGISLLTMIMDHDTCKNIPVIMMSSHDSINMVFKCMLKGAADFLVKPIRKNELRNLWQHVWRRHTLSDDHGGMSVHRDVNLAKKKLEANSQKGNLLNGYEPSMPNNKECEKGSDTESSCTRSDMEAESTYKQISLEPQQPMCRGFSLFNDKISQNGEDKIQLNWSLHKNNNNITNEAEDQNCDQDKTSKQVIDLIGVIGNQRQCSYGPRHNTAMQNNLFDAPEMVFRDEDVSCKSAPMPLLELSLRRYQHSSFDKEDNNERSTLNHSDSSAFSLYNSRTPVSNLLRTLNFQAEAEEYYSPSTKQIPDEGSVHSYNVPRCNDAAPNLKAEDARSLSVGASSQDGIAIKCSPLRVIPLPIQVRGMNFDTSARYGTAMQPFIYPQSSVLPLWSTTIPSLRQEATRNNSSYQSDPKDFCNSQSHHPPIQSPQSPVIYSSAQIEAVNMEPRDELQHVTSITGDSGSTSICHVRTSHINSNGHGSICSKPNGNISIPGISHATAEVRNQEGKQPKDLSRLNQREAALNKFRLKRKDRCFEKKVRYQSRKRLAELRPRVKGQFVRHTQPGTSSTEAGSYHVQPVAG